MLPMEVGMILPTCQWTNLIISETNIVVCPDKIVPLPLTNPPEAARTSTSSPIVDAKASKQSGKRKNNINTKETPLIKKNHLEHSDVILTKL